MACDIVNNVIADLTMLCLDEDIKKNNSDKRLSYFKSIKEKYGINDLDPYIKDIVRNINEILKDFEFETISEPVLEFIIKNPNLSLEVQTELITTKSLDTSEKETYDLLGFIFKDAVNARETALNRIKYELRKAVFYNDTMYVDGIDSLVNQSIKLVLEDLLLDIINYLNILDINLSKSKIYGDDGKYTGVIEELVEKTKSKFFDQSTKEIMLMSLDKFNAFVAYNVLTNFDLFLIKFFGNLIKIVNYTEKFTEHIKYSLNPQFTNVAWSSETSDEIDVSKSLNNLTRFFIETTPRYDATTKQIKPNEYLNFLDFIDLICTIKNLSWVLNSDEVVNSLTFESYNLRDMLSEALVNEDKWNDIFNYLYKYHNDKFLPSQRDTLYSLNVEILGKLKNVSTAKRLWDGTYYHYFLQTINSLTPVNNSFYVKDDTTGAWYLKNMKTSNFDSQLFLLNHSLNLINLPIIKKYEDITYSEVVRNINLKDDYMLANPTAIFNYKFKVGDSILNLDFNYLLNVENNLKKDPDLLNKLALFIEDVLGILLLYKNELNSDFFKVYSNLVSKNESYIIQELALFALELVKGNYVLLQIDKELKNVEAEDRRSTIETIAKLYNTSYKINDRLQNLDIVPSTRLGVLENISKTLTILNGLYTGAQVKDSLGNSLATSATNRLLGVVALNLFNRIKNNPNCPANKLSLITRPNLLQGIYSIRDLKYSDFDSKQYIKCNSRELGESCILFDFLLPLLNITNTSDSGNLSSGNIGIITSVNSDKPTIAKMLINLKELFSLLGVSSENFLNEDTDTIEKLKTLTRNELGGYYAKLIENINSDLNNLSEATYWKSILGEFKLTYDIDSYKELTNLLQLKGISVQEFLQTCSKETGIQLNDLLHVTYKGNEVIPNYSLISLYARYNDVKEYIETLSIPSFDMFFYYKNLEIVEDLLKNGYKLDISKFNGLEDKLPEDWVSKSKYLIIGKLKITKSGGNTETIDLVSETDLNGKNLNDLISELNANNENVEFILNPIIEKFNLIDHLFSQEYLIGTVGTHINHPSKVKHKEFINFIADEANRFSALHKRNVSQTALMHIFNLNQINGIPSRYNISCIKDIKDLAYNISGVTSVIKPFDGATFVNGPVVYLENYSLNGEKAGTTKKLFVHFYEERFGTGGIIKTAGFGITNKFISNSPFLERMFHNMNNKIWKDELGEPVEIDITLGNLREVNLEDAKLDWKIYYTVPIRNEDGSFSKQYRKISKIKYLGNSSYDLTISEVSETGEVITEELAVERVTEINTGYNLWKKIFKGTDSVSMNKETGKLSSYQWDGEASMLNYVNAINRIGWFKGEETTKLSLETYYQPLKHSMIHYTVTEGAIKQGAANMNNADSYYKNPEHGKEVYQSLTIEMRNGGILLNKEHNADNSEVSIMTLVISACAALGYTWDESNALYNALARLALRGLEEVSDVLGLNKHKLVTIIVKQLANGTRNKDGLIHDICEDLIASYIKNGKLTQEQTDNAEIPISNPDIFGKVQSLISSTLTKLTIKLKFSGILAVLTPSHEILKLYNGKLKSEYVDFDVEMEILQANAKNVPINLVEIGVTYIVSKEGEEEQIVHILAPHLRGFEGVYGDPSIKYMGYYDFKKNFNGWTIKEDYKRGRNLAAYSVTFTGSDGKLYSYYDIKLVKDIYTKNGEIDKNDRVIILNVLKNLSEGDKVEVYTNLLLDDSVVESVTEVIIKDITVKPFEAIVPKIYALKLGLRAGDTVLKLLNDPNIFINRIKENLQAGITNPENACDVILKNANGEHVYILDNRRSETLKLKHYPLFKPIVDETGIYYYKQNGDKQYLSSVHDTVYMYEGKDIIGTDNIDFYLKNTDYVTLETTNETIFDTLKEKRLKNSTFRKWVSNTQTYDASLDLNYINELGRDLYNSFKATLDVVAARIPALSMLSFMAMKIVGFEEFDVNNVYVSTHQIWLLGSK